MSDEQSSSARSWRLIDFHVHPWHSQLWAYPERLGLSPEQLVNRMDREGIDKSVMLPEESPECTEYILTRDVIAMRDLYPERLIAFVGIDPRAVRPQERVAACVEKGGCLGFGELKDSLEFDDPLHEALFEVCNQYQLPLVFHCDARLCRDDAGLPRLERMAARYPQVKFVGHGPGFWSAISGDDDRVAAYPKKPVQPGGALDRLMAEYDNIYGEFSAGSGHNAMTRDPEYTLGFVERHHRKLVFGTDFLKPDQHLPQVEWLTSLDVPIEWRQDMAYRNAERLLGIGPEA